MPNQSVVIFKEVGSPKVLELVEQEIPVPGPREVRLKLTSIGLNRTDSVFREGVYFTRPTLPSRIGYEGAGIVDAVGPGGRSKEGDRMAVIPCTMDVSQQGCCAEYAIFPESILLPTPPSISDELAGSIWMKYITSWGALVTDAKIKKGEHVVISAASSSVGVAAIQVANARGAISIATTTSPHKMARLKELGAAYVLDINDEDYVAKVKSITSGMGANVVFDPVAGPAMGKHLAAAAPCARIYLYGLLDPAPMDVHPGVMIKKMLSIKGFNSQTLFLHSSPEALAPALQGITQGIEEKKLQPVIAERFPLVRIREAFEYLESNQQIGKIVVHP
jgi:NADPH:quinone reductase-like Zn-dependent oxidoreductase